MRKYKLIPIGSYNLRDIELIASFHYIPVRSPDVIKSVHNENRTEYAYGHTTHTYHMRICVWYKICIATYGTEPVKPLERYNRLFYLMKY